MTENIDAARTLRELRLRGDLAAAGELVEDFDDFDDLDASVAVDAVLIYWAMLGPQAALELIHNENLLGASSNAADDDALSPRDTGDEQGDGELFVVCGRVLASVGDLDSAVVAFQSAAGIEGPHRGEAFARLGSLYAVFGDETGADLSAGAARVEIESSTSGLIDETTAMTALAILLVDLGHEDAASIAEQAIVEIVEQSRAPETGRPNVGLSDVVDAGNVAGVGSAASLLLVFAARDADWRVGRGVWDRLNIGIGPEAILDSEARRHVPELAELAVQAATVDEVVAAMTAAAVIEASFEAASAVAFVDRAIVAAVDATRDDLLARLMLRAFLYGDDKAAEEGLEFVHAFGVHPQDHLLLARAATSENSIVLSEPLGDDTIMVTAGIAGPAGTASFEVNNTVTVEVDLASRTPVSIIGSTADIEQLTAPYETDRPDNTGGDVEYRQLRSNTVIDAACTIAGLTLVEANNDINAALASLQHLHLAFAANTAATGDLRFSDDVIAVMTETGRDALARLTREQIDSLTAANPGDEVADAINLAEFGADTSSLLADLNQQVELFAALQQHFEHDIDSDTAGELVASRDQHDGFTAVSTGSASAARRKAEQGSLTHAYHHWFAAGALWTRHDDIKAVIARHYASNADPHAPATNPDWTDRLIALLSPKQQDPVPLRPWYQPDDEGAQ